ncbi:hypothetical protein FAZ68_20290, partial [Shigella boydii]|nr:hypothetical protein [Shigella boydii]
MDVRPRSQSLSRNRRRGRITGFQTTSRSDRADCDNRPALCKRLVRTVLIFTESSDQLSRATDRVP